jgi:hypothetical protein
MATAASVLTVSNQSVATHIVWTVWNLAYASSGTSNVQFLYDAASTQLTNVTAVSNQIWAEWNGSYVVYPGSDSFQLATPEEIQRAVDLATERAAHAKLAKGRARKLLVDFLEDGQRASFEKDRYFIVHSRDGLRRYKVTHKRSGNVKLIDSNGKDLASFCIHPQIECPDEDTMLAQKLMLETDEKEFLRIANHTIHSDSARGLIAQAS